MNVPNFPVLKNVFGFSAFKGCQEAAIDSVLQGRDQLVIMATGGGKSLCYQVPPLVLNKPAVVVSPLISLMQDQVMALNARNISACFLGSAQTDPRVAIDAWNGKYSFIYVTPELAVNRLSSLADLHRRVGLALLAIDEAHCVSEWGLDFRPEYRQLHTIRQHLQGVPIMALTATATPRVRSDIVTNLQLASSNLDQWVQSFERPNLYFEVCRKGTSMAATLRPMLDDIAVQPTIIYCVTRRETQAVADILSAHTPLTGRVGVYHADLPMAERHRVHAAFMRDQITVVCCTIAFAMGIDKSNVRKVIHYGIASSLEGYYQQAGRAGRDGLPAKCTLLWSHADASTQAAIKDPSQISGAAAVTFQEGLDSMMSYATSGSCRHSVMVNHFDPGTFTPVPSTGKCGGGCDNCATTTHPAVDVTRPALLMASVLDYMGGYFGLGKVLLVLRGSKSKEVRDQWKTWRLPTDGTLLWGAGSSHGEEWWKGMVEILLSQGLAVIETRMGQQQGGGRSYTVTVLTAAGKEWLQSHTPILTAPLTPEMQSEEKLIADAATAVKEREAAQSAVRDGAAQQLYDKLFAVRQQIAIAADLAPTMLLTDAALWEIARKRPDDVRHLSGCEGCGGAFIQQHGAAFVKTVVEHTGGSSFNSNNNSNGWRTTRPASATTGVSHSEQPPYVAKLLNEPKGAATDAHRRFCLGETLVAIATMDRPKPINPMTVAGYVAEAAAVGVSVDWSRLAAEAAVGEGLGKAIAAAIEAHGEGGFKAVRQEVHVQPAPDYGQIKIVAAMLLRQGLWFQPAASAAKEEEKEEEVVETAAKRQRIENLEDTRDALQTNNIDSGAVVAWLEQHGPATGPQLAAQFCCDALEQQVQRQRQQQLSVVLAVLIDDYLVCRKGGVASTSSEIDLVNDNVTQFMAF